MEQFSGTWLGLPGAMTTSGHLLLSPALPPCSRVLRAAGGRLLPVGPQGSVTGQPQQGAGPEPARGLPLRASRHPVPSPEGATATCHSSASTWGFMSPSRRTQGWTRGTCSLSGSGTCARGMAQSSWALEDEQEFVGCHRAFWEESAELAGRTGDHPGAERGGSGLGEHPAAVVKARPHEASGRPLPPEGGVASSPGPGDVRPGPAGPVPTGHRAKATTAVDPTLPRGRRTRPGAASPGSGCAAPGGHCHSVTRTWDVAALTGPPTSGGGGVCAELAALFRVGGFGSGSGTVLFRRSTSSPTCHSGSQSSPAGPSCSHAPPPPPRLLSPHGMSVCPHPTPRCPAGHTGTLRVPAASEAPQAEQ